MQYFHAPLLLFYCCCSLSLVCVQSQGAGNSANSALDKPPSTTEAPDAPKKVDNGTGTSGNVNSTSLNSTHLPAPNDNNNMFDQKHKILLVVLSDVNVRKFDKKQKDAKCANATSDDQEDGKDKHDKERNGISCAESRQYAQILSPPPTPSPPLPRPRPAEYYEPIACETIPRDESLLNNAIRRELRPSRSRLQGQPSRYSPDVLPNNREIQASFQQTKARRYLPPPQKKKTKSKPNFPSYPYALQTEFLTRYLNPYKYLQSNYDYSDQYDYSAFANPWQDCNSSQEESSQYDDF